MSRRWTLYSILATVLLVCLVILLETSNYDIAVSSQTSQVTVFIRKLFPVGFILAITAWIYLILYAQLQKHPELFQHQIWKRMPVWLFILGTLSIFSFMVLGFFGPLMGWVEKFPWLNDVFITYFIFLLFLFVLSVVRKDVESDHKAVHVSFVWTAVILVVVIFLM